MTTLRFTLLAEGSSDRVLIPIIRWMLLHHHGSFDWIGQSAELHALPQPPKEFPERISVTNQYFPSDVLFIHRDADKESVKKRREEIASAFRESTGLENFPWIPVIPVRMTEAWLLISETAIRSAVGNLPGKIPMSIPSIGKLEKIPNPKELLEQQMLIASELTGRRRKKFHFPEHRARIPEFIDDWGKLLKVPSARTLFEEIGALDLISRSNPPRKPTTGLNKPTKR